MISERKFVSSHSSFWRVALPMGEAFVRRMNVHLGRFAPPLPSEVMAFRKALVSELSFRLYAEALQGNNLLDGSSDHHVHQIRELGEEVRGYISHLDLLTDHVEIERGEIQEAIALGRRLREYFRNYEQGQVIAARPQFLGCGIIDACEGDILAGTTLYEVKNVGRDFRLADLRQLLCYCALNTASPNYKIDSIGLVNARGGVYYSINLNAFCLAAGGTSSATLLSEIVNYISVDRPSR